VAGNEAPDGQEIYIASGTFTSQGHNLFGVDTNSGVSGASPIGTDIIPAAGVLIGNIIDDLLPNGGSTETHLLVAGSPAIDAGSIGLIPGGVTTDQRGTGVDIGAIEGSSGVTTYSVTYDGNSSDGGSVPTDPGSPYASGATVTVRSNTGGLTKTGFTFVGWNTAADGSGTDYGTGATFTMGSANVTLYALWTDGISFEATNNNDSGSGSLRRAILKANAIPNANTITFQTGLTGPITLTSGEIAIKDDLTIQGPGAGTLAISGSNASRIFKIDSGKIVNIDGLTLQNGNATTNVTDVGGAIRNYGTLNLANVILSGNQAKDGGAIFNAPSATMTVTYCILSSNSATSTGGGIENYGTLDIINSSVFGNTAKYVGGISHHQSTLLNIINSTIANNSASGSSISRGGGIGNHIGTITIINSTVSGNSVIGDYSTGGGINGASGPVIITNSTITGNTAAFPIGFIQKIH